MSIGDQRISHALASGNLSSSAAATLLLPVAAFFVLGLYWLQRLFAAYAAGSFFTDETMRCYLWLVWLKVINFVYHLVLPVLARLLGDPEARIDAEVVIDAGAIAELMVLLLIVHILKEAQRIKEENKGFV